MSKRGRNNGGGRRLNGQKQGSKRCKKLKGKQRRKCLQQTDIKNWRNGRTNNPKKYVTSYLKKEKKRTLGKKLSTFEHFFTFAHREQERDRERASKIQREPEKAREGLREPVRASKSQLEPEWKSKRALESQKETGREPVLQKRG